MTIGCDEPCYHLLAALTPYRLIVELIIHIVLFLLLLVRST